jgi:hypothetical protein
MPDPIRSHIGYYNSSGGKVSRKREAQDGTGRRRILFLNIFFDFSGKP